MTTLELLFVTTVFSGLLLLRFGLPLAFMWLMRRFCTRVLHLQA